MKAFEDSEKFSSGVVVDDEDNELLGLEGSLKFGEEGMGQLGHNVSFIANESLLLMFQDKGFAYDFQSVKAAVTPVTGKKNL